MPKGLRPDAPESRKKKWLKELLGFFIGMVMQD